MKSRLYVKTIGSILKLMITKLRVCLIWFTNVPVVETKSDKLDPNIIEVKNKYNII